MLTPVQGIAYLYIRPAETLAHACGLARGWRRNGRSARRTCREKVQVYSRVLNTWHPRVASTHRVLSLGNFPKGSLLQLPSDMDRARGYASPTEG